MTDVDEGKLAKTAILLELAHAGPYKARLSAEDIAALLAASRQKSGEPNAAGLLPCPFCGDGRVTLIDPPRHDEDDPIGGWTAACQVCAAMGPAARTRERAISIWNSSRPWPGDEGAASP